MTSIFMFKSLVARTVEKKLQRLILRYNLGDVLSVEKIKGWIYHEGGDSAMDAVNRFQKKLLGYFKDIKTDVLPRYQTFLSQEKRCSPKAAEAHMSVAETFFERVWQVGFLDFKTIRPEFARYEFPRWWQTHVLSDDRDENEIWTSLKIFLSFLKEKFNLEMRGG